MRVFEWNGTMLHAKTAVADSNWARVGSTNLNVASWFGNLELDVVIEDEAFAEKMDQMYLRDLENATEVVLDARHKLRAPNEPRHPHKAVTSGGGSAGRAAAGAPGEDGAQDAAERRMAEPLGDEEGDGGKNVGDDQKRSAQTARASTPGASASLIRSSRVIRPCPGSPSFGMLLT